MLRALYKIPTYVYLAGLFGGAAAAYVFYTPSKSRRKRSNEFPRGLINYNNECFINSLLQSLAASDVVKKWLLENISSQSLQNSSVNLFDTLASLCIKINREEKEIANQARDNFDFEQQEFYAAQDFKRALSAHNWLIQSEEHDCHELFHLIMDVLDEESLESKKSLTSLNYFSSYSRENSKANSKNPFQGYLITQLQCLDCSYKYPFRLESFYSLSLSLPQTNNTLSHGVELSECINNYFRSEHISDMKCEMCSKKPQDLTKSNGFVKKQAIAKLPECLCLQIQRNSWSDCSYEMIKQQNFVQFPTRIKIDNSSRSMKDQLIKTNEKMSLKQFQRVSNEHFSLKQVGIGCLLGGNSTKMKNDFLSQKSHENPGQKVEQFYELSSAIVHYGSAHSGHFVSFRKPLRNKKELSENSSVENRKDYDWLQISDSIIKKCRQFQLLSNNVYMLFYDKKTLRELI